MALYIIGIGLDNEKDITLKGLEIVKKSEYVFLEYYTSKLNCSIEDLEKLYGKKIIIANRELVEKKSDEIILPAKEHDVAFLVMGDALSATTHTDLMIRAKEKGIDVFVVNNASIFSAVALTGLQLYKFGKATSIPFLREHFKPETFYDVIKENKAAGLHTLVLLDLDPVFNKFMAVNEAIKILFEIESRRKENVFTEETLCVGCARLGSFDAKIKAGSAGELFTFDFGAPVHCLIIPGKMHFMEEDFLKLFM